MRPKLCFPAEILGESNLAVSNRCGRQSTEAGKAPIPAVGRPFRCPFVVHRGTEPVLHSSNGLSKFVIQNYDLELQQSIDTGKF